MLSILSFLWLASGGGSSPAPVDGAAFPDHWRGPGPIHKVAVESGENSRLRALRESTAAVREHDYGSFSVFVVDERLPGAGVLDALGGSLRDEWNLMAFGGHSVDGTRPEESWARLAPELRFGPPERTALDAGAGLFVVQFEGPIREEWTQVLDAVGARFRQYVPMHAYVVSLPPEGVAALAALDAVLPELQYVGAYHPAYRLTPALRRASRELPGAPLRVTVQLVDGPEIREALEDVRAQALDDLGYARVGPYVNLRLVVDPARLTAIAHHPRVFGIEELGTRARRDERQGQISAGNVSGGSPTGPGYLAWLASRGFGSGQFGSFSVNVVDDATSLTGHADVPSGRIDFQLNPTSQSGSQSGHGFLNAHIVAGFNSSTGSAFEDTGGYNYGLGIAPWAHVGATAIFGPGSFNPTSYESSAYGSGARISTNSWSFIDGFQNPIPDYDSYSQEYDFISRDARTGIGGNQEYLVLFSAGNDGSSSNTVSTPSTAKNILTVGASENDRPTGTDGCGVGNNGANDADDLIGFSSQGPVDSSGGDGRWKPEIVAPGTHIQAGVPQSSYDGSGVCNQYFPSGQTLYGWSSGTSHSTPGVAGGAALVYQWFLNEGLGAPSPAMMKAMLVASGEYLTGVLANDTLPSNGQGMGRMNLERLFGGASQMRVDQTEVLASSGATHVLAGNVDDPGQPFRVTLVWTDAPGPTTGAPFVNDLDLTVDVGGTLYRGNVFSGEYSTSGGSADFRNNTESVFLPSGTSGAFVATVTAASIGGDGVPGNADGTDQDFALFVHNGTPEGTVAQFSATPTTGLVPLEVTFTDLSLGDVTTWDWDFGDGGSSTVQNPVHTYTSSGSYTVELAVDGPEGSDVETKVDWIVVEDPPPPGISDASFEGQSAGTAPTSPWGVSFGSGHVVSPSGVSSDGGMPTDGTQWCELAADSTDGATPPSNPGGAGSPPVGGAGITQDFTYPPGQTELRFEAAFLRNETAGSTYNDWMSVDLTDGSTTYNVFYKDTFSATSGTSAKYGYAITPVETVVVDLLALFPTSTPATVLTLTAEVGNGTDDFQPSKGYVDDFRFLGEPAPSAEFTGSPTSGTAPLSVSFTDQSNGTVTSWSWDFGDGSSSSDQNPAHAYDLPGDYTVSLTATGPSGSDQETKASYVSVALPPQVGMPYGSGSNGSLGVPTLTCHRSAGAGAPLYLAASDVASATPVFFAISTSAMTPTLDLSNGFLLNVGLPIAVVEPFLTDGSGETVMKLNLGTAIAGISLYCQLVSADGTGGDTFASSVGVQVDL